MALLTPLSDGAARDLLALYDLTFVDLEALAAGSVNSNFFVRASTTDGAPRKFFARIYEEQKEGGAQFELGLGEVLSARGIPVARPVRLTDGSLCAMYEGKPFALYERLEGSSTCLRRVTVPMALSVGKALARVHLTDLGDLSVPPSRFDFAGIRQRLTRVTEARRADLQPDVDRLFALADRLEKERRGDLPNGLIHGDLFRDNVLVQGDEVIGLLDFESASRGTYLYDLLVTVLAWCFTDGLRLDVARAMVEGYTSMRPLTFDERASMTTEGSVACLRFATTRLTDFSLRAAPGEAPGRDYRRFFARLEALQAGHLDQATRGLFRD